MQDAHSLYQEAAALFKGGKFTQAGADYLRQFMDKEIETLQMALLYCDDMDNAFKGDGE